MIDINEIAKIDALDMKQVSELAKQFITELNGQQEQFQVEEVTLSGEVWLVTVSYFRKFRSPNELQKTLGLLGNRVYKRISIDRKSYHILGMQNWSFDRQETARIPIY